MIRIALLPNAERLVALRAQRGLDRDGLAELAGCSARAIEHMEQGSGTSLHTIDWVASALKVGLSDLAQRSVPDDTTAPSEIWVLKLVPATADLDPTSRTQLVQRISGDVAHLQLARCRSETQSLVFIAPLNACRALMNAVAAGQYDELDADQIGWLAPAQDCDTEESATLTFHTSSNDNVAPAWTDRNDDELTGLFEPGSLINDRYLIHHTLGRGAMGRVFLATDQRLQRPVALKVVAHAGKNLEEALAREARMGANLSHRAIATVLDYGFVGDKSYTVFEYIIGELLRDVLRRRETVPLDETCQFILELAAALDFAHSQGIIHRDLKPENICCQRDGQVKILDLGIARDVTREVRSRSYSGTPAYSSPEQARCMPTTGKSDQYALALIAFEMLTGVRAFSGADPLGVLRRQISNAPPRPCSLDPSIPESVESTILRALSKDPANRFATCQEFAAALAQSTEDQKDTAASYLVAVPEELRVSFYVSHIADDSLVAKRITAALEEHGHRCWYCGRDAIPGVPFRRQSQDAIKRSAANLLLISRPALNSADFANEIQQAHEIGCPLLPLLVDVSQDEFEKFNPTWRLLLGGVVAVEFQRRAPLDALIQRLLSATEALGIAKSMSRPDTSVGEPEVSGQAWATDANQIAIQDLERVVYRNDLISDFLRHRQKHFLSGTKGIGKTLLLTYKRHLLAETTNERSPLTLIPEGRPYLDLMSEMRSLSAKYEKPLSSLSTTKRLWGMALRISAISHHPAVIDPTEKFELDAFPNRIRRWLEGVKIQPTVVFKELTSLQVSQMNQLIDATENFLDQKVREIHSPICFFVDRVDQAINHLGREPWIYIQAGLIEAGWDLMNSNSHIKLYATIRQEAFTNYESDVKANLFGATTSLQYADEELAAILDNLSSCYEGRQRFADFVGFHVIRHPARAEPEDCFQFIRRHTFGRPRDLVMIAGELASRRSTLNEKMVSDTVRELASSTLVANIFEEVRILHDCLHDRDVRSQFLAMLPTNIIERADANRLCEEFNGLSPGTLQHFGEDSMEVHHPFRDLYLSGLLGVIEESPELGEQIQRFRQPKDMLTRKGEELPESDYYLIHPALNAFIRQHRTRKPYRQLQHIATGEGQFWRPYFPIILQLEKSLHHHSDQRFVTSIHQLVKRCCSFLQTGSTEFARAEIEANANWDYVQSLNDNDEIANETLLWLDELMTHL